jgi:ubiquinone/menaquinone biosynthesis C-methylase UbiE
LKSLPQGRLLDVGCGAGEWLLSMREMGWQVEGVDFDENAVRVARKKGLEVHRGSVEQQSYPDQSFDAVTMHHVIEHVPDPAGTLTECARLLKPGGKLVLFTPNGSSLSHGLFKQNWRGLEPPRHLHIFTPDSMHTLLHKVGFQQITIVPQIARSVIYESIFLWLGHINFTAARRDKAVSLLARCFNFVELGLIQIRPSTADCMAAIAVKT